MDRNLPRSAESATCHTAVAAALHTLMCEDAAHAEMRWIRGLADGGVVDAIQQQRYRQLWVAVALRRTPCSRSRILPALAAEVATWQREHDALEHERARHAVDSAFGPDDATMPTAGSSM